MLKRSPVIALLAAGSLFLAACGDDEADSNATSEAPMTSEAGTETSTEGDIIEVATAAGSFNTLAAALEAAGLVETLQGEGPFTVFAPTDEAFAALVGAKTVKGPSLFSPPPMKHLLLCPPASLMPFSSRRMWKS